MRGFQYGDIEGRLKALLQLQGRSNFAVEESILPVVLAGDAHELPFANEPRAGAGYGVALGAAGQQGTIAFQLTGPGCLWLTSLDAAVSAAGLIETNRSGQLAAGGVSTDKNMLDVSSNTGGAAGSLFLPVLIRQFTTPPAAIGPGIAHVFSMAADAGRSLPLNVLLRTNEVLYVKALSNAVTIRAAVSALYYPSVSPP